LRDKVKQHCVHMDFETPVYGDDQGDQIEKWMQAHADISQEILSLRLLVQRANLDTPVSIQLNGKSVTKSIAAWIHRRRDLAESDLKMWHSLTDKNLREGTAQQSDGSTRDVRIVRYYDPKKRDEKLELYRSEPSLIDATLEVVNAVTEIAV